VGSSLVQVVENGLGPFFSGESIMTKTFMRVDKISAPLPQNGTRIERLRCEIDRLFGILTAKNWWLFTLRGVFGVLFGLIALIFPGPTMLSLALLFSAYVLVDGIVGITSAVRAMHRRDQWGLLVLEGIINILVGIGAFLWPGLTVLAFVLLVAAWALVTGGLMAAASFRLNLDHGRVWLLLGGLLSVAFGVLLIITPVIGAAVLTWWMGAYALAFGIALVIFSFKLRARQDERARPHTV
jgi:uncharacterized membrane protein HdeD (DUF308 family)